ncbi:MAG: hypothetical protein LAO77_13670 [Acidobacteriia bacterium]|nr:hypothetical protein [Terriglobia bacterium]
MVDLRIRLSALVLMAAVIATNGAALLAAGPQHAACVTTHHECDQTTTIRSCCCNPRDDSSNQGGPLESRVQIGADASAVPLVPAIILVADSSHLSVPVHTSPPRAVPLDLPTLFAALLI